MALQYGVLRGKVQTFKREDDNDSPHFQIKIVDGHGAAWRVPFNVQSGDGSDLIYHKADPLLSHPILDGLAQIATGFTALPVGQRRSNNSLDFLRAPLFDWASGRAIDHFRPGENNDLQDELASFFQQLQTQQGEIFAFGAMFADNGNTPPRTIDQQFGTRQGVHDIHMNQGNPHPGRFSKDNGVHQDGGLLLRFPNRVVGLFGRFQSQLLPTDNSTGHPLANAKPVPPGAAPLVISTPVPPGTTPPIPAPPVGPAPRPVTSFPTVYIERALINPSGDDLGKEIVVLGNTTTAAVDLSGWSIVDKNDVAEVLSGVILPPGESRLVALSGTRAQLSNKGGTIRLKNAAGDQMHAVTYSKSDADAEGRYLRFNN